MTWVAFDQQQRTIDVPGSLSAGAYSINIVGTLPCGDSVSSPVTINIITNLGPPTFTEDLTFQIAQAGSTLVYKLPPITDPDGDDYTVSVNFCGAQSFSRYQSDELIIAPGLNYPPRNFQVVFTLTDKNMFPLSSYPSFTLFVVAGNISVH